MRETLPFLFILISCLALGQTTPSGRMVDWTVAGYQGVPPVVTNIIDITTMGGAGDSLTDNSTALNSALGSLGGNAGVIFFPPGNYIFQSSISLPDSVTLKGAGSDSTHLIFNLNGAVANCINISGNISGVFTNVLSGLNKGSNYLVVDTPIFSPGDYAEFFQDNGSWDTQPVSWADESVGQIVKIASVSGDTVFLSNALRLDYVSTLNPRMQKINPRHEVAIECLRISRADDVATGVCYNVYFNYAVNCRMKGIESSMSIGSHIQIDASSNIDINGCYLHHAYQYDGTSTHGYGLTLFRHSGECRIENNIFEHLRHSISLQTGANGNVIAYNYSTDPFRSEAPNNFGADISLHGHYPFANLFEGNIVQNIMIDQTWGPSGPYNTFLRNWAELYGIIMSSGTVQSDSQNFVGNEVTNTNILLGNYILFGTGHFEHGNNIRGTITPAGTSILPDSSYYLMSLPGFLSAFPAIGTPYPFGAGTNPAKDRITGSGSKTVCEEVITSVSENTTVEIVSVYPNPTSGSIYLTTEKYSGELVDVLDLSGRIVHSVFVAGNKILLPDELAEGVYFLRLKNYRHPLKILQN